ncbi:MAG: hypothetical protein K6V36_13390 [Anaerolineae bacterium]|nr:hypothetical protein [Anaerolineae bacterium]
MEIDLAVAWEWPYDAGFVERLAGRAESRGLRVLPITPENLTTALEDIAAGRLRLRSLLDRASDARPEFLPLSRHAEGAGAQILNPVHHQDRACDKARNHLLLATHGIPVPFTVIAPPFIRDPSPPVLPAALGRPFIVKPAGGSGSEGVILDAQTVADVQHARRTFWRDRYLLQQRVYPRQLEGRRAWFRVFYVCGSVIPCWWDDVSHAYAPLSPDDEVRLGLTGLGPLARRIGELMALDFFTTEIVLGCDGRLLCVDYANSPCDMRLQSQHHDGVPDAIVDQVVDAILEKVACACEPAMAFEESYSPVLAPQWRQ